MRIPTDPESLALIRALKPFLSSRGKYAVDDLLGAVNLLTMADALGGAAKVHQATGERPLAFLSMLADMNLDPTTIAKAVSKMADMPKRPESDPNDLMMRMGRPAAPSPDDIGKMMQAIAGKAATDPEFAKMLGGFAENGLKPEMMSKLFEMLGPDMFPKREG